MMDIKATLSQLTLEEKTSLLSGLDCWHTKPVERAGVPAIMVSDGPHGLRKQDVDNPEAGPQASIQAVCFPAGCASAASFDRALMASMGEAVGQSAQHEGVAVVLGPAVNIKRSPLCGRNFEYVSEDPCVAGELGAAFVNGLQSQGVGASVKHFACNNQEFRRMSNDAVIDDRTLREIYLAAFETIVKKAAPWTLMCSYNRVNGVYSSDNQRLLTDILRWEWGFDGLVMSDWGAVNERVVAVEAGLDLEMPGCGGVTDRQVTEAVNEGRLDETLVDTCAERVLQLVDRFTSGAKPQTPWDKEAQHALARRMAAQCMVLLKNDGGLLPLSKTAKVAVLGGFAKKPRFQGGGSSHINAFRTTSAWDALHDQPNVTFADGYRGDEPEEALLCEAEAAARAADVAVVFAGLPDEYECEGYDREHLRLPASHNALIERVAAANPRTVVVLHNGSPVAMPWLSKVAAVLEAYLGGQAVGGAAADVLFGDASPEGRLPETFPLQLEDNPSYPWYHGEGDACEYREGVFVGYRWYDKRRADVLFPFGYGLSYTSFAYSSLRLSADSLTDNDALTVSVDVTNTGKRPGREVVQLYVAPPADGVMIRPVRELRDFAKVLLSPGETATVTFTLGKRAFAYWEPQLHDWQVETGEYRIQIGHSSRELLLEQPVQLRCTVFPQRTYVANSLVRDLQRNPKAAAILAPYLEAMARNLSAENNGEAGKEAITPGMQRAMMMDLPLRGLPAYVPELLSGPADVEKLLQQLNS